MAQTLQDFLISIGYKVDAPSQAAAQKSLRETTFLAFELGESFVKVAADIEHAVSAIERNLNELYWTSMRTGAAIEGIKAMQYAAAQLGSSAGSALSALESVAKFMATNPAGEGWLRSLGVQTRDANGHLLETAKIMSNIGEWLRRMPMAQANIFANFFGIDYKQLVAMRQGMGEFETVYKNMVAAAHINMQQIGADVTFMMNEWRTLGAAFGILGDKVSGLLARRIGEDVRRFRLFIVSHFDLISTVIETVVNWFYRLSTAFAALGSEAVQVVQSIIHWWNGLDSSSQNLIKTLGLIALGIKTIDEVAKLSLLGRLALLGIALLALWQDYKVWEEDGKSLINWEVWEPQIQAAERAIRELKEPFVELWKAIKDDLIPSLQQLGRELSNAVLSSTGQKPFEEFIEGLKETLKYLTLVIHMYSALARRDWKAALGYAQETLDLIAPNRNNPQSIQNSPAARLGNAAQDAEGGALARALEPSVREGVHEGIRDAQNDPSSGLSGDSLFGGGLGGVGAALGGLVSRAVGGIRGALPSWVPGSTRVPPLPPGQAAQNRREIADEFERAGYQSAPALGNAMQESSFNPQSGRGTGHQGIFQWSDTRRRAIEEHFGKPLMEMTPREQARAAIWEIETNPQYARTRAALRGQDMAAGTRAFAENFEAPANIGTPQMEAEVARRYGFAQEAARERGNTPAPRSPFLGGNANPAVRNPAFAPQVRTGLMTPSNVANTNNNSLNQTVTVNVDAAGHDPDQLGDTVRRRIEDANAAAARQFQLNAGR